MDNFYLAHDYSFVVLIDHVRVRFSKTHLVTSALMFSGFYVLLNWFEGYLPDPGSLLPLLEHFLWIASYLSKSVQIESACYKTGHIIEPIQESKWNLGYECVLNRFFRFETGHTHVFLWERVRLISAKCAAGIDFAITDNKCAKLQT